MLKSIFKISVFILILTQFSYGQDFSALWQPHFSYYDITDVVGGENKIYAAAENAVFQYDTETQEIKTITTIEGLSGQQITTIYYSSTYQYLLIGYETGLMEVYSETDESVLPVVDILEKQNITPENKQINHFYENDGLIYISTNYGISVYNLEGLEFGDTYFLGNAGLQVTVKQVSVLGDKIYAACLNANGIKRADLNNANLIDYQQWENVTGGNYYSMNTLGDKVYAVRSNKAVYEVDDVSLTTNFSLPFLPSDAKVAENNLMYSFDSNILIYDPNLQEIANFEPTTDFDTDFTSATQVNDFVYIGTEDFGLLKIQISEIDSYTEIRPNGPLKNSVFRLNATSGTVWATYGEYKASLNPYPLVQDGISVFKNEWENIPFDSLLGVRELNEISINPFNNNEVYISSMIDGLLAMENFEATVAYDETNSTLEVDGGIRVSASEFDAQGKLWITNSRVENALKSYDPTTNNWSTYSFSSIISVPDNRDNFYDMEIGNDGTKWIGAKSNGLIAYNENKSNSLKSINTEEQGFPLFPSVTTVALDNRNQLWIGTIRGLRVLYNTGGFFEDPDPKVNQIIILEDGVPKELLEGQSISDIKVDGSNNKWIGTVDSGLFYFSSDGQKTIYHFTTDNSPLPSNRINDISINPNNGIVYIATTRGLVSFTAGGSKPKETLNSAFVYPNPVRPEYDVLGYSDLNNITKGVKVSGLTDNVNIKITDIEGNLVAEAQTNVNLRSSAANYNFAIDGGTAVWNGRNMSNSVVRSGVYLILISDLDTFETKVLKVLIIK